MSFWSAGYQFLDYFGCQGPGGKGPTPLIAAMRAYVASKRPARAQCPHTELRTVNIGHDEYESVCVSCGAILSHWAGSV